MLTGVTAYPNARNKAMKHTVGRFDKAITAPCPYVPGYHQHATDSMITSPLPIRWTGSSSGYDGKATRGGATECHQNGLAVLYANLENCGILAILENCKSLFPRLLGFPTILTRWRSPDFESSAAQCSFDEFSAFAGFCARLVWPPSARTSTRWTSLISASSTWRALTRRC